MTLDGRVSDDGTRTRRLAHLRTLSDDALSDAAAASCYVPLDEEIADLARQVIAERKDEFDPIPWFTDQHARKAAERMKAWASGAGHVPQLAASVLSDAEWLNLARVALELRVRDD